MNRIFLRNSLTLGTLRLQPVLARRYLATTRFVLNETKSTKPQPKGDFEGWDPEIIAKLNARPAPKSKGGPIDVDGTNLGFSALPNTIVTILKLMVAGVATLLLVKTYVNSKKNKHFKKEQDDEKDAIRPGFPTAPSGVTRKSEYEGAGNSYVTRKSGDKLTR
ncbi:hypothetical protein DASC09_034320 [Saccharomycopsis crataegensis]|uniref:Uncharacterized protein n=1 Tax=Saccharomycopsis crataegensis TaxID=43959 RepID=A0AAV5QND3_9ASCO|nr:hypothetical protein DASC09_034320 [Saccharomycopsis crataegensis]